MGSIMNPTVNISKSLITGFLLHTFFSINLHGQNWLPLEVGNRWDYRYSVYCHGGSNLQGEHLRPMVLKTKNWDWLLNILWIKSMKRL